MIYDIIILLISSIGDETERKRREAKTKGEAEAIKRRDSKAEENG